MPRKPRFPPPVPIALGLMIAWSMWGDPAELLRLRLAGLQRKAEVQGTNVVDPDPATLPRKDS